MTRPTLQSLYRIFIEPPAFIQDIALQHKSRLLNIFLLIMILVFLGVDGFYLATIPSYIPPWYGYIFLFGSYFLNHTRSYRFSALLTLIMFPIVIFFNITSGESTTPVSAIYYLIPGLILAGVLLTFKLTVLFALLEAAVIVSMPYAAPGIFSGFDSIVTPLSAMIISAVLVVVSLRHRDDVEADRQELLRNSEERYRLVSSVISDYSFSNIRNERDEFILTWAAGAFEQITGYTLEEYNAHGGWVSTVHPDDLEQDSRDMQILFNNQQVITELRTLHKDGSIRWVRSYVHPLWDTRKDQLSGIYGAVQDITERKKIEREREELILELGKKNAELEQFTYTVSHDLKAPVITIKGFLGFLAEDALSGNIERLQADIQRISDAANKMHKLLNDLLELSRIGRVMDPPQQLSFGHLVQDAVALLQGSLMGKNIKLVVETALPDIYGDRQRLIEVVQNLLDNAIKFMGDQEAPVIEVGQGAAAQDGFIIFFVRDNGIGIAPQYHERIFGLFNRLNPHIEGTGIGLALVRRIVEFHAGRVWVESEAGAGATFFFTLPVPPSDRS